MKEHVDTPTNPDENANTEGHPETASFEAVNEKDKDKSYRTLNFTGLKRDELHAYLDNIEAIRVNGEDYAKAFSALHIEEKQYIAIKSKGDSYQDTLRLDKTFLVEGENEIVIELKDKTKKILKVNLASEKKEENASDKEEKAIAVETIIKKTDILFGYNLQVKFKDMDEKAMPAFEKAIKSVVLNGKPLKLEKTNGSQAGKYYFTLITGGFGGEDQLILSPEDAKEKVNTLVIEAEGYKNLTVKFDQDGKILKDVKEEKPEIKTEDNRLEIVERREASNNGAKYFALSFPEMSEEEAAAYLAKLSKVTVNGAEYSLAKTSPYKLWAKQYFADKKESGSSLNAALALTQAGGVKIGKNEVVLETKDGESRNYLFMVEGLDAPTFKEAIQKNTGEVEIFFTGEVAGINSYLKREQLTVTVNGKKLDLQRYYTNLKDYPAIGVIEAGFSSIPSKFYIGKDALQAGENTVTISSPDYKEQSFSFTYEK